MPADDTQATSSPAAPSMDPASLRAHLQELEAMRPRMDALDARLRQDKAAREAIVPASALTTVYDQYESARHLVMFEKIGLRLAIKDGDAPCAENHKKTLVEAAKEVERLEGVARKCQNDIQEALQKHGFASLEEAQAQQLSGEEREALARTLVAYGRDLQATTEALAALEG